MKLGNKGQAMVECVLSMFLLMFVFLCGFYTFLLATDKIRALDASYTAARSFEVGLLSGSAKNLISTMCLGRSADIQAQQRGSPDPEIQTTDLQVNFAPRSLIRNSPPWTTTMRVPNPESEFLTRSWPGAPVDTVSGMKLAEETAALELMVKSGL